MKELGALPRFQQNAVRPQEGPTCRIQFLPPKTWDRRPWPPPIFSAFPWGDLHGCCPPSHRPRRRLELEIQGGNPPELAIDGYNKHLISKWETTWNNKVSPKKTATNGQLSITILSAAKHFTFPTSLGMDCKSFLDSAACGKTLSKLRRRAWKVGKSSVMRQVFGNFIEQKSFDIFDCRSASNELLDQFRVSKQSLLVLFWFNLYTFLTAASTHALLCFWSSNHWTLGSQTNLAITGCFFFSATTGLDHSHGQPKSRKKKTYMKTYTLFSLLTNLCLGQEEGSIRISLCDFKGHLLGRLSMWRCRHINLKVLLNLHPGPKQVQLQLPCVFCRTRSRTRAFRGWIVLCGLLMWCQFWWEKCGNPCAFSALVAVGGKLIPAVMASVSHRFWFLMTIYDNATGSYGSFFF